MLLRSIRDDANPVFSEEEQSGRNYRRDLLLIDRQIFFLLESRFSLLDEYGHYKKENHIPFSPLSQDLTLLKKLSGEISPRHFAHIRSVYHELMIQSALYQNIQSDSSDDPSTADS